MIPRNRVILLVTLILVMASSGLSTVRVTDYDVSKDGQSYWHEGTFSPSNYLQNSGGQLTGEMSLSDNNIVSVKSLDLEDPYPNNKSEVKINFGDDVTFREVEEDNTFGIFGQQDQYQAQVIFGRGSGFLSAGNKSLSFKTEYGGSNILRLDRQTGDVETTSGNLDLNNNKIVGGSMKRSMYIPVSSMTYNSAVSSAGSSGGQGMLDYLEISSQDALVAASFILPEDYKSNTDIGFCGHSSTRFASGETPIYTTLSAMSDIGGRGTSSNGADGASGPYNTTQTTGWNYGNPDFKAYRTCDLVDVSGITQDTNIDGRDLMQLKWEIPDGLDGSADNYDRFMLGGLQVYYTSVR